MPTSIMAAMLAEMTAHPERCYTTFDWTIGGLTYKLASRFVASESAGMYLKRIPPGGWGPFTRPDADESYHLSHGSGSVQFEDDAQGTFGKAIGGPLRGALLHSTGIGTVRSPAVEAVNHYQFYSGRVFDWSVVGQRRYELSLGPDALALESEENNIKRINRSDWPNAPARSTDGRGAPGQVVYGKHRSSGLSGSAGLVPTIPVDDELDYWYVSIGLLPDNLVAVWRNGTEETANWSLLYVRRGGTWYTVLTRSPVADQATDEVQCDLDGVESFGDGSSGTLITNDVNQLSHFLTNFIWNAYPDGSIDGQRWLALVQAPINSTSFAAAAGFTDERSYAGSRVLTTENDGLSVINEWGEDHKIGPFWTSAWTLGLNTRTAPIDLGDARLVRMERLDWAKSRAAGTPRTSTLVNRLEVSWAVDHAAGGTKLGPKRVADTRRVPIIKKGQDLQWVQSAIV